MLKTKEEKEESIGNNGWMGGWNRRCTVIENYTETEFRGVKE